jgi:hypothetical protein
VSAISALPLSQNCLTSQSWRFVAHEVRVISSKKEALQALSIPKNVAWNPLTFRAKIVEHIRWLVPGGPHDVAFARAASLRHHLLTLAAMSQAPESLMPWYASTRAGPCPEKLLTGMILGPFPSPALRVFNSSSLVLYASFSWVGLCGATWTSLATKSWQN